jgi:hypothetical protein
MSKLKCQDNRTKEGTREKCQFIHKGKNHQYYIIPHNITHNSGARRIWNDIFQDLLYPTELFFKIDLPR